MIIKKVKYLQEAIDILKSRVEDLWPLFVMVDILRRAGGSVSPLAHTPVIWFFSGINRAVGLFLVVFGMSSERWLASVSSPPKPASLSTVTSPPSPSVPTSIAQQLTKSLPFRDSSLPILPRVPNTLTVWDGSYKYKLKLSGEWLYGRCAALLPPWWLCLLLFTLSGASGRM